MKLLIEEYQYNVADVENVWIASSVEISGYFSKYFFNTVRTVSIIEEIFSPSTMKVGWTHSPGDNIYSWGQFLSKINPEIYTLTESSDKQMGYFFAKADNTTGIISEEVFLCPRLHEWHMTSYPHCYGQAVGKGRRKSERSCHDLFPRLCYIPPWQRLCFVCGRL